MDKILEFFNVDQYAKEDWTLDNRDFKQHPVVGKFQSRITRNVVKSIDYRDALNVILRNEKSSIKKDRGDY